ncbi:MAG TPA: CPBP family intramembrane glutamic endopeptidase [Bacteroidia bacterium]|jgi:membrane protease YdiL (CAAX protease family)|nr:CPBP family intramembrane glutamic endopeptidase [Bacteroidia bacterium]
MNNEIRQRPAPFENVNPFGQLSFLLGIFFICLIIFALLGALCIVEIGHVSLLDMDKINDYNNPQLILGLKIAQIISSFGTFIVPAVLFAFLASRKRGDYLMTNRGGKPITFILAGLLMLCASPFINYLSEINSHMKLPYFLHDLEAWMKESESKAEVLTNAFMAKQSFGDFVLNLFMIGLLAAVSEELFFRSVLQKIMINWTRNVHVGIWLTGALFSALHFEFYGFLPRMLMGVYLGYLFVWSGTIWVPVFAHFVNNGTAVLLAYLEDHNAIKKGIDEVGSQNSDTPYIIGSTIIIAVLLFFIYKIENKRMIAPPAV